MKDLRVPRIKRWIFTPLAAAVTFQLTAVVRIGPPLGFRILLLAVGLLPLAWTCSRRELRSSLLRLFLASIVVTFFWLGLIEVWLSFTTPLALGALCFGTLFLAHLTLTFARLRWPAPESGSGGTIVRLGLLLTATAFLAVVIESGFGLVLPANVYEIMSDQAGETCLVLGEDGILHATPGFRGRYVHPEFHNLRVEINADGLRDGLDESSSALGTAAIVLLLGDSQAFGTGVELRDTFQERLERSSATILEGGLRIHCAALPGDGQVQQLDRLDRWAPILMPKLVIVAFYEGNDMLDNLRVGGRRHGLLPSLSADGVERDSPPKPSGSTLGRFLRGVTRAPFWLGSSSAVQYLQPTIESQLVDLGWLDPRAPTSHFLEQLLEREPPGLIQIASLYTRDLLQQLEAHSLRFGAELIILVIPAAVQADPWRYKTFLSSIDKERRARFDRTAAHDRLMRDLRQLEFQVIDALPALERSARDGRSPFHHEGHLNSLGHLILHDQLAPTLQGLLRGSR